LNKDILENLTSIYSAAVEPDLWGSTLEACASGVGAVGALILSVENSNENPLQLGYLSDVWRKVPELIGEYNRDYAHLEKDAWDSVLAGPEQQIVDSSKFWAHIPDIMDRPDFLFLKEHAGAGHRCAARLNDNNRWFEALTVHFNHSIKVIPQSSIADLKLIVPHIAKSIEMGRTFGLLRSRYQAVLAALDFMDVGLCIALSNGNIVVHNKEAQRIFDLEDGLSLGSNRKLQCRHSDTKDRMAKAISVISNTAVGEATATESLFSIPRRSTKESYLVEVAPIRDVSSEIENNLQGALVMIVDVDNTQPISKRSVDML